MDSPELRLTAAVPAGVVRDGHEMALVRLEDVKSLCAVVTIYEREGRETREQRDSLQRINDGLKEEIADLKGRINRVVNALNALN